MGEFPKRIIAVRLCVTNDIRLIKQCYSLRITYKDLEKKILYKIIAYDNLESLLRDYYLFYERIENIRNDLY